MNRSKLRSGFTFQRRFVDTLKESGLLKHKEDIYPTAKNVTGADVQVGLYNLFTFPFVIEVKNTTQCEVTPAVNQVFKHLEEAHNKFSDKVPILYPLIAFNNKKRIQICTHYSVLTNTKNVTFNHPKVNNNGERYRDCVFALNVDKVITLRNLRRTTISFDVIDKTFEEVDIINYQPFGYQMIIMSFELFVEIWRNV